MLDAMTDVLDAAQTRYLDEFRKLREEFSRFMFSYKFGMEEVATKVGILQQEFQHLQQYNPIEHVSSRLKSPESVLDKIARKNCAPNFESIRETITDIAGVRVTCSFTSDVYRVSEALTRQDDITVLQVKDYVREPKPNGYRSLHLILEVPVFLSTGGVTVPVEVQLRTVAMDFWASLEHKIYYKYDGVVPADISRTLSEAAETAARLDTEMEQLHRDVHGELLPVPVEVTRGNIPMSDEVITRLIGEGFSARP
ncbi:RelA/SpoT domain-containing protein [Mycolicibacterium tokaiense]|uniref:RelA/SpoT domain-containing protein n=2 Tax=Mycobacteriaceae TaxID=1762 RepID=A0A378TEI1_9MYCO|nr:GTP pyrophosphokinase [Mycolicibacterium tokaiense]STZ58285.1 RelA/SpoT domain-containing protein [Mycolicibacterium tokaiense]